MKRPIRKGNHVAGNIYLRDIALFLAIPGFFFYWAIILLPDL